MGNRISKYERSSENDIGYRGPLNYRHLMIFGWICIALKVLVPLTSLGIKMDPNASEWMKILNTVSSKAGTFALFFFLIANFAIILDKKKTYKAQLIKFGGLSILVVFVFLYARNSIIIKAVGEVIGDKTQAVQISNELIQELAMEGSMVFNLFIDMFMCTLLMFFLEYMPVNHFQGGKIKLFRAMAVLPILYEAGALGIRVAMVMGNFRPPYFVFPLLTTKPFMSFILFVILALHIKWEDHRFRKRGKTAEEFEAYLQTNAHSVRFSIFTSIMIAVTAFIDLFFAVAGSIMIAFIKGGYGWNDTIPDEIMDYSVKLVNAWKIGTHFWMIALIPIVLLFSYTRNPKNPKLDIFVPVVGLVMALVFAFIGIRMNLPALKEYVGEFALALEQTAAAM